MCSWFWKKRKASRWFRSVFFRHEGHTKYFVKEQPLLESDACHHKPLQRELGQAGSCVTCALQGSRRARRIEDPRTAGRGGGRREMVRTGCEELAGAAEPDTARWELRCSARPLSRSSWTWGGCLWRGHGRHRGTSPSLSTGLAQGTPTVSL